MPGFSVQGANPCGSALSCVENRVPVSTVNVQSGAGSAHGRLWSGLAVCVNPLQTGRLRLIWAPPPALYHMQMWNTVGTSLSLCQTWTWPSSGRGSMTKTLGVR